MSSETAVKAIHPVYVDGPLKGKDFPVAYDFLGVTAIDPDEPLDSNGLPNVTTYTLRKFGLRSGDGIVMLWLATAGLGEPDAEVLADLLLSDAAKAARAWSSGTGTGGGQ